MNGGTLGGPNGIERGRHAAWTAPAVLFFVVWVLAGELAAAQTPPATESPKPTVAAATAGVLNSMCPVLTDEPVDPEIVPVEYKGINIGFCCNKCRRKFLADPEEYVANVPGGGAETGKEESRPTTTTTEPTAVESATEEPHSPMNEAASLQGTTTEHEEAGNTHSDGEARDSGDSEAGEETHSAANRLPRFFGQFHPVVIHFPIALLLAAALAELIGLMSSAAYWRQAGWYCALLGAAGAVVAATLGWADAAVTQHPGVEWVVDLHRWLGTATAAVAVLAVVFHILCSRRSRGGFRIAYLVCLFLSAALVGVTGHFGAALIYGLKYFSL